ncbi:MAG: hypothetical protein KDG89_10585, partial [Geminicoccaceae bacterium]|nr:hypothetical protein [Geminicoccaceae bacterium]
MMGGARPWITCATLGVAALLGGPGQVAFLAGITFPLDKLLDAFFDRRDTKRRERARELCGCIEAVLAAEAARRPERKNHVESARLSTEAMLKRHGLDDAAFVALDLNAKRAADAVLAKGGLSESDAVDTGPLIEKFLVCFYAALPANPDLLAEILPHLHRATLDRLTDLKEGQETLKAGQADLLAGQDETKGLVREVLERVGSEKGMPLSTLEGLLQSLGEETAGLDAAGIERRLRAAIDRLRRRADDPPPLPFVVPAPEGDFTGREADVEAIVAALKGGGAAAVCAAVSGMGGVGKTQLARAAAAQLRDDFPDGGLSVDLRGTTAPLSRAGVMEAVLRGMLGAEAKLPEDGAGLEALYRRTLAGRRFLVVFDDAENTGQVEGLLPDPPAGAIVTSRTRLSVAGPCVRLDVLPRAEAVAFLAKRLPVSAPLDALADACADLPLALRLARSYLDETPHHVAAYVDELKAEGARLRRLDESAEEIERPKLAVRAALALSLDRLKATLPDLAPRWPLLGAFPTGFDAEAAAAVLGMDAAKAGRALGQFVRRSLIQEVKAADAAADAPPRFRLHDLLRDLAREGLDDAAREKAGRRHAAHYQAVLARCNTLYLQGKGHTLAGLRLFDLERANVEAGQAWAAARAGADDDAARLARDYPNAGVHVIALRLHARAPIAWLEAMRDACRGLGDRRGEGRALGNLGLARAALGET